ncbi:MAG: motility-associated protein, partial [Novosphingobium sp.]
MYAIIGIVILLAMVFGGFAITGGALGPVMHAIPHEMLIIGGAAIGATVTGNSLHELKLIGGAFGKIFKGPKHTKQDHIDAIILTTKLMKLLRSEGPVALESHVTEPKNSAIFAEFPRLLANHALVDLICDTLTLIVVSSGTLEVHAVEEVMDNAMKTHFHEMHEPQHA